MKRKALALIVVLFAATFLLAQESYDQLVRHWDYDRSAPLNVKEAGVQDRVGITVHDISYSTPAGERAASIGPSGNTVTAYLIVPPGKGPFPAVVYGHWCMPGSE